MATRQTTEYLTLEDLAKLQTFPEPPPVVGEGCRICSDGESPSMTAKSASVWPGQYWGGYVYLIWQGDTMYFKVGRTGYPHDWLQRLQEGNPLRLNVQFVRCVSDVLAAERDLVRAMRERYPDILGGGIGWFKAKPGDHQKVVEEFMKVVTRYS